MRCDVTMCVHVLRHALKPVRLVLVDVDNRVRLSAAGVEVQVEWMLEDCAQGE